MDTSAGTGYARSGDVNIAYRVVGSGPFDLVFVPGFVSNVELDWADPQRAAFLSRLSELSRLITPDKRGTGLSDRVQGAPSLETRMDDIRAVMDAAESGRAALFGLADGGCLAALFSATYPERTAALVLYGTLPRYTRAPGFPWAPPREEAERGIEELELRWGTRDLAIEQLQGSDGEAADRLAALMRRSASPGAAAALARMNLDIDVTHVLGAVRVPTLVLHRSGHPSDVRGGRYLASRIPSSRFVELEGDQAFPYLGDSEGLLGEIERFLTGLWQAGAWAEPERERVMTTVLFTDIAGSTRVATELGDARWRELLEQHHALIRSWLLRFRGRELDTAGDGFFASFDGPARAIRCACAITENVRDLGIEVRAGLHTGECEAVEGKVSGIAVHIGARVAAHAAPGEVLVSNTVKDLVAGSGIAFSERGVAELKGVPGEWKLFLVEQ